MQEDVDRGMSVQRFDELQAQADALYRKRETLHPLSREYQELEFRLLGIFLAQASA